VPTPLAAEGLPRGGLSGAVTAGAALPQASNVDGCSSALHNYLAASELSLCGTYEAVRSTTRSWSARMHNEHRNVLTAVAAVRRQLNESPQAQEPLAFGLSMVKPCFSMVSTKSMEAP
jgi:hypothetical protein